MKLSPAGYFQVHLNSVDRSGLEPESSSVNRTDANHALELASFRCFAPPIRCWPSNQPLPRNLGLHTRLSLDVNRPTSLRQSSSRLHQMNNGFHAMRRSRLCGLKASRAARMKPSVVLTQTGNDCSHRDKPTATCDCTLSQVSRMCGSQRFPCWLRLLPHFTK